MPPVADPPVREETYINPGNMPVNFPSHPGSEHPMVRLVPFKNRSKYPGEPFFLKGPINHYNKFVKAGQLQPFRDPLPTNTNPDGAYDGPQNFSGLDQTILAKVREVMLGNADDDILSAYQFVLAVRAGRTSSIHTDLQIYEPKLSAMGRGLANADKMFATAKKNADAAAMSAPASEPFVPTKPELPSTEPTAPVGDAETNSDAPDGDETSGTANRTRGGNRNRMPQPRPQ